MNGHVEPLEIQKVDYQAAYAALARRVSAAYAYGFSDRYDLQRTELEAAMEVIQVVENPLAFVNPS